MKLNSSVGVSKIPCSYKRLNVARERLEATLFYYSHLNVRANVHYVGHEYRKFSNFHRSTSVCPMYPSRILDQPLISLLFSWRCSYIYMYNIYRKPFRNCTVFLDVLSNARDLLARMRINSFILQKDNCCTTQVTFLKLCMCIHRKGINVASNNIRN